jgi:hypothetical protein
MKYMVYQARIRGTRPTFKVKVGSHNHKLAAETVIRPGGTHPTRGSQDRHHPYTSTRRRAGVQTVLCGAHSSERALSRPHGAPCRGACRLPSKYRVVAPQYERFSMLCRPAAEQD